MFVMYDRSVDHYDDRSVSSFCYVMLIIKALTISESSCIPGTLKLMYCIKITTEQSTNSQSLI